ncbi:hypothetical protein RM844_05765 [Streptomyces sp. DSM 44915]|uniref:Uncharacterized protein n=1 Tax=Streptomyces chisholmiae TaxID=3075540 RepID=A0ABU2JM47_9ACTN|nr:hypothetical protein [Streptomyces sp. DSM 44915]MDT0265794.1 hypothetical protein [Streptomyces sp. DSM 44915]
MSSGAVAASLAALRADPATLTRRHPHHTFRTADERLARWEASGVNPGLFRSGQQIVRERFAELGLTRPLPLSRTLVGAESTRPGAFGGFHHPDQGYRHLQAVSVLTMYGPMEGDAPAHPKLALLDLLRAWAHDSLHYGSRRRYVDVAGVPTRVQYGINYRRANGASYSAADAANAPHTRNLGVVMEGACDREARRLTRAAAARSGVTEPEAPSRRLAFRDFTGCISPADVATDPGEGEGEEGTYLVSLARYERGVNQRYAAFLAEFAPGEEDELHGLVLRAVISGRTAGLSEWLDERHGPGAFSGAFLAAGYFAPPRTL